jgi:hypothetical protein
VVSDCLTKIVGIGMAADKADQQEKIDQAVQLLVCLLESAVAEDRHGTIGVRVSIHDGVIRTFHETSEFTLK